MSEVKTYKVVAVYKKGLFKYKFAKEFRGLNEKQVIERAYSFIGSKHGVPRYNIRILEIKEVPPEEVQDNVLKYLIGGQ